jgi:hypothetical protein
VLACCSGIKVRRRFCGAFGILGLPGIQSIKLSRKSKDLPWLANVRRAAGVKRSSRE